MNMKNSLRLVPIFALIWVMMACQSLPSVSALQDDRADFSRYETFGFHPQLMLEGDEYDKLSTRYIKEAIVAQMQNKGYRLAQNPDLWLNFNTYTQQKIRVSSTPQPFPYYHFRYNYGVWPGYPMVETRVDQYTEGTLNIDVIDRSANMLVWEGIAIGKLNKKTMDNLPAKINQAVSMVFEPFPLRL
ncbi:MAG: hypothetical protein ACJA13_000821 [Paraglaciecola sp.]|jgi:hypothetical protein